VALALLVVAATLAPVLAPHEPTAIRLSDKLLPPSAAHWLGTDYFGRDVLSRVLHGGRVSLAVGLLVVAIAMAVGVPLALVAGFIGAASTTS
jgi:peptide/nickel transport system permease protein